MVGVTFINIIKFCVWSVVDNEMMWGCCMGAPHPQVPPWCQPSDLADAGCLSSHLQDRPALGSQTERERKNCGGSEKPSFVDDAFIFMNDVYLGYASRKGMAPERALFLNKLF